eukprot:2303794-Amphidinium_carterae.1
MQLFSALLSIQRSTKLLHSSILLKPKTLVFNKACLGTAPNLIRRFQFCAAHVANPQEPEITDSYVPTGCAWE